jgi:hypothetical protein
MSWRTSPTKVCTINVESCAVLSVFAQQFGMRGGQEPALGRVQIDRDKDGFLAALVA